jgi:hypothetical protein
VAAQKKAIKQRCFTLRGVELWVSYRQSSRVRFPKERHLEKSV